MGGHGMGDPEDWFEAQTDGEECYDTEIVDVCPPQWITNNSLNFRMYRATDEVLAKEHGTNWKSWAQSQKQFECVDCGINTLCTHELYILKGKVWHAVEMTRWGGMLCIGCLEGRLGRELTPDDFDYETYPMENSDRYRKSDRLLMRLAVTSLVPEKKHGPWRP